jgi:hypothetical protein
VARASLSTLHALVMTDAPSKRGFESADEAARADLAEPFPMQTIGLKALSAYRQGQDPRALLVNENVVLYPVVVGADVRSSITLQHQGEAWEAVSFGRMGLARSVAAARARLVAAAGVSSGDISLVEVPGMSIHMLNHTENGTPVLTTLEDVHGTSLRAGQTLPASDVLTQLAPLAAQSL